jgi:DNA processing protein
VLGTGVDVPYPAGHRTLHERVQLSGLVISEVEPGTRAFPGCFPRRNRVIAGLCKVLVVVEAGFQSGAINSATQALELGRTVAAVPGQIDDARSAGANLLIRDGAQVLTGVEDLLGLYGLSTKEDISAPRSNLMTAAGITGASQEERHLLRSLGDGSSSVEDLAFTVGLTIRQVSTLLLNLECAGLVTQDGAGYRRAR